MGGYRGHEGSDKSCRAGSFLTSFHRYDPHVSGPSPSLLQLLEGFSSFQTHGFCRPVNILSAVCNSSVYAHRTAPLPLPLGQRGCPPPPLMPSGPGTPTSSSKTNLGAANEWTLVPEGAELHGRAGRAGEAEEGPPLGKREPRVCVIKHELSVRMEHKLATPLDRPAGRRASAAGVSARVRGEATKGLRPRPPLGSSSSRSARRGGLVPGTGHGVPEKPLGSSTLL